MVYGVLFMLNFAHGEIYMIGGFVGWWVLHLLTGGQAPMLGAGVIILLMILSAMVFCGFLGVGVERVAYRPLRNAPRMNLLLCALGRIHCSAKPGSENPWRRNPVFPYRRSDSGKPAGHRNRRHGGLLYAAPGHRRLHRPDDASDLVHKADPNGQRPCAPRLRTPKPPPSWAWTPTGSS